MKHARHIVAIALLSVLAALFVNAPTAQAADSCYGSGCVGVDPSTTTCANDAKTIRAINVDGYGMLQMRWSRSCNAGWARFTSYRRPELFSLGQTGLSHAYVSAWTDQGTQDSADVAKLTDPLNGSSWWGRMIDFGRPEVCVGVRIYVHQDSDTQYSQGSDLDLGWTQGPCVT